MTENTKKLMAVIEGILGGSDLMEVKINDPRIASHILELRKARTKLELTTECGLGISIPPPSSGSDVVKFMRLRENDNKDKLPKANGKAKERDSKPRSRPAPKRHQHSYVAPKVAKDMIALLVDEGSHILQLVGPTGCGKTTLVDYLGRELGRKVFQINCRGDMGSESFVGEKTIVVDEKTGQNVIEYQKGLLEQAMTEGLDENGQEVGDPAIFFVDEVTACPAHVAHVLNRFLESDDPRRTLVLDLDGGRTVRSHSGLRVIVGGNTVGRGATGMDQSVYTAQLDALDLSFLSRIRATFKMGYNKKVEMHILKEKIGDDRIVQVVMEFRDVVRGHIKGGKLVSPFTTRHIIDIADMFRVFGSLTKAVYYGVIEQLLPEERALYNETAVAVLGADLLKEFSDPDVDYM